VGGYGFVETEPKTKSSRRKIAISEKLLEALKVHCEQQGQMRLRAGEKWHEQSLVFCNRHGKFLFPEVVLEAVCKDRLDLLRKGLDRIDTVFAQRPCQAISNHFTHSLLYQLAF